MNPIRLIFTLSLSFTLIYPLKAKETVIEKNKSPLLWSDEFNGTGLPDSTKWGYEVGFIRNNEKQFYRSF